MKTAFFALALLLSATQLPSEIIATDSRTPAEQKIGWAKAEVKEHPNEPQPYNDLAIAFIDRARETCDTSYLTDAETAVRTSLSKSAENFEGRKAQAMILVARGQFQKATELARKLNVEVPDDVLVYGILADAYIETGHYEEAVDRTQWMLNLRSGNIPGLLRAARLRWIYGDDQGSLDLYNKAYEGIPATQTEDQAWVLNQMAKIHIATGHLDSADQIVHAALEVFPGYYLSLETAASLQTARKNFSQAVALLRQRNQSHPTLQSRYELARALERAGEVAEAKSEYAEFEAAALSMSDSPNNANVDLTFYYLSSAHKSLEALRIAAKESRNRQDVATEDAYAWALYLNGRLEEAEKHIRMALITSPHNAEILYHAGAIAKKRGNTEEAIRYLTSSLNVNPSSESAHDAQMSLDTTQTAKNVASAN